MLIFKFYAFKKKFDRKYQALGISFLKTKE